MKKFPNLLEQISEIRDAIYPLHAERASLQQLKRSRTELVAEVDRRITELVNAGRAQMLTDLRRIAVGDMPNFLVAEAIGGSARTIRTDLGPVLAALLGEDALRAAFLRDLERAPDGLDSAAKADRLKEIEAELLTLEMREEALIVDAEAQGLAVFRRPDARPEIVLGAVHV